MDIFTTKKWGCNHVTTTTKRTYRYLQNLKKVLIDTFIADLWERRFWCIVGMRAPLDLQRASGGPPWRPWCCLYLGPTIVYAIDFRMAKKRFNNIYGFDIINMVNRTIIYQWNTNELQTFKDKNTWFLESCDIFWQVWPFWPFWCCYN